MKPKILVVDDEASICDLVKINLELEGYEVSTAGDGEAALRSIELINPDLLILDIMLPKINGYDICKKVTYEKGIPVIMLTAKTDLIDKVLGLELGADDYITKPFHARELVARVKALLRRVSKEVKNIEDLGNHLINGSLEVFSDMRKVILAGSEVELSAKEYELVYFLINHLEQVFTRDTLLEKVWGYDYYGDTRTVDVHIQRLRKKLSIESGGNNIIQTVFGVGYKMARQ
ncbi:response regulator transcription factor [Pseudobacteroides cellulosolvens]|uniref:Stage 0 sporulation protein A homolog n=1 Tax=Pseudobacteroides cellulosolvens ATCC 35603 = DSM 2933 TaxID=398512 RepID=A0A0L6JLF1_9FIRM|nr:response regulator transcription factor [Pseudobacteroides cellulosolvens]KNY26656.1 two component transcriptional regulator, winged helix family [Pseudobacteroides cellulosolvens ATCC 35603 = DSM 2933]